MHLAIDFETYYDDECSIVTLGSGYFHHPKFNAYLVAINMGSDGISIPPSEIDWNFWLNKYPIWVSHNASFDKAVYQHLFPDQELPQEWNCTANLSVFFKGGRKLSEAAKHLLGETVSKDVRKQMKDLSAEIMKTMPSQGRDHATFFEEVRAYALHDAEICWKLWDKFSSKWPQQERQISEHTINMCLGGIPVDEASIETDITKLKGIVWDAEQSIPWVSEGKPPMSHKALAEKCRDAKIDVPASLAVDSPECQAWEEKYGDQYAWVAAMRDMRRSNILLKRLQRMQTATHKGRFYYGLKYFGAHTGRWGGNAGFNIQNIPKKPFHDIDVRNKIVARPGKKLIIADFAQIEARITLWFARDFKTLKMVEKGISIYEAHARTSMGWTGGILKEEDPKMYWLAKQRVLSLGFGCGAEKFKNSSNAGGVPITLKEATKIVNDYRESSPGITAIWRELDTAYKKSIGGDYEVELPSWRSLFYEDIKREYIKYEGNDKSKWVITANVEDKRVSFFGAKIFENLVQATARDVMVETIFNLTRSGYNIIFHVHDEVVMEEDESKPIEPVIEIMSQTPDWLKGCLIGVEVVESQFYLK